MGISYTQAMQPKDEGEPKEASAVSQEGQAVSELEVGQEAMAVKIEDE